MKRSAAVPLTLVTAATAGALAACGRARAEPLNCVESASGRVVPDSLCAAAGAARPTTATGPAAHAGSGGISPIGLFGWYYGGRVISGLVRGGSYAPAVGRSYRSPTGAFLGGAATRTGQPVRPSIARPSVGSPRPSFGRRAVRGGFGGIGAGRVGGG